MGGRYRAYPEYRDSGVEWLGEVPEYWTVSRIKFFSILNPSKSGLRNMSPDTEVTFLPMESIGEQGAIDTSKVKALKEVLIGYTYLGEGDVCVAKITPCFENGKGAVVNGLMNQIAFATTEVIPLRCLNRDDSKFLYYLVTSAPFNKVAEGSMYGAGGQKRVSDSMVANYHFAMPPLVDRQVIANFLDHETAKIDTLIEKQQQLIKLLKEKRQAVISHAVTKGLNPNAPMRDSGVEWLGEVPEHWVVAQLKFNTLEMQTGPFGSQLHAEDYVDDGIPLVNPAHMVDGRIVPDSKVTVDEETSNRLKRHHLVEGDLIFARRGELGRCAIVTKDQEGWLCGTGSLKAKLNDRLISEYAYLLISSEGVMAELSLESKGSTMDNLNTETLGRVRTPVPPVTEQTEILAYVDVVSGKFEKLINKAIDQVVLLQERRTALISAAVTGKIDVRDWRSNGAEH